MSSSWVRHLASSALVLAACSGPAPKSLEPAAPVAVTVPAVHAIDRIALRADLAEHRARQLAHLHAYGLAGQFPHDTTTAPSLHMFRDPEGRLCAVANLVQTDGRGDLVDATARDHNDLAIADVTAANNGTMTDWIQHSGLTQEELVAIQMPAPLIVKRPKPAPVQNVAALPVPAPMTEAQMNAAVARHVADVEAQITAATEKSLDVAVERYVEGHASS